MPESDLDVIERLDQYPDTMRILIVEGDPGIAEFVQQRLQEAGYAVDVSSDGTGG